MLILQREEAIEYFVDEVMFNISRVIWDLLLREVFPKNTYRYKGISTHIISSILRYMFGTFPTVRCIKLNEIDAIIPQYTDRTSDQTLRGIREVIVGYEMTDLDYKKLLEKPSTEKVINDYIRESKRKRDPEGIGWFMAIKDKGDQHFSVYPYDKRDLRCRDERRRRKKQRSDENENDLVTSTRSNIEAVWNTAISVYKMVHDKSSRFRDEIKDDLLLCSTDSLEEEAYDYMNSMDTTVWLNGDQHKIEPCRMKVVKLIREKLREYKFDDKTPGLFQTKLKAPGEKILTIKNVPKFGDGWDS